MGFGSIWKEFYLYKVCVEFFPHPYSLNSVLQKLNYTAFTLFSVFLVILGWFSVCKRLCLGYMQIVCHFIWKIQESAEFGIRKDPGWHPPGALTTLHFILASIKSLPNNIQISVIPNCAPTFKNVLVPTSSILKHHFTRYDSVQKAVHI